MSTLRGKVLQAFDFLSDTASYGMKTAIRKDAQRIADGVYHQIANEPINAIGGLGQAFASPVDFAGRIYHGQNVGKAFNKAYMKNKVDKSGNLIKEEILDKAGNKTGNYRYARELDLGNVAGTAVAGSLGLSVVGGLTHDTSGNVDIAGIPGI